MHELSIARDLIDLVIEEAARADASYVIRVRLRIGALAGALGGLDTLVFAGGIGEHDDESRARICAGLEFLGIEIDRRKNAAGADIISKKTGKVTVRVIKTDEEWIIARAVSQACGIEPGQTHVAMSHTHGSGWMSRTRSHFPGGDMIGPYLDELAHKIAQTIAEAGADLSFFVAQAIGRRYSAVIGFANDADAKKAATLIRKAAGRK